ncbi:MAG: hypothetical protein DMG24_03300 [Acidobacteria bacterium]|nr:MAG: hypothetical protein DMG24_03300 [Acidobacteriota bacterium]
MAAGASCAINVTFTPAAAGTRSGTLSITDNASGSPQSVSLTGVGNTPAAVSLLPSSVSFGSQTVGTTSAVQAVALTNTGGAVLSLTSVTANGDFAQTNNCGSTVAAGASCAINVTFTPAAAGSRSGTLSITDNATGSPQSVSLTGTGSTHGFSLSPTSLTFASQLVGTTSAPQVVALSNPGNLALDIASIAVSGDFAQASDCGSSVAAGATCAINVTASPSTAGTRSGILTVTDKAGTSHAVSLTDVGADFLLAASSTSASIAAGGSATYKVTLTPAGGFDQTVSLSCSGAPDKTTCSVSPASVTLAGSGASTASVSITTTEASVALPPRWTLPSSQDEWFWPLIPKLLLSLIALAVLSTLGCTFRAWRGRAVLGMRPGLQSALFSLLLLGALAMPACGGGGGSIGGGGSPSNPGTPAGTYTLTVSASSTSGSTTLTHDIKLTLKIN